LVLGMKTLDGDLLLRWVGFRRGFDLVLVVATEREKEFVIFPFDSLHCLTLVYTFALLIFWLLFGRYFVHTVVLLVGVCGGNQFSGRKDLYGWPFFEFEG
jgi:hypothetical protein